MEKFRKDFFETALLAFLLCLTGFIIPGTSFAQQCVDYGNGTVRDYRTGLIWQKETAGGMNWDAAVSYASGLLLGAHTGWGLPSVHQLHVLYNSPCRALLDVTPSLYWSSTPHAYDTSLAWGVVFSHGGYDYGPKSSSYSVRACRSEFGGCGDMSAHTATASAGSGGSVTPTSSVVAFGTVASFTVTTDNGYTHGAIGGTCPSGSFSSDTYTTGIITDNCSVSFSFNQVQRTVTASAESGGNVTPSSSTVGHGSTASFTVTPNLGYSHGSVGGTCPSGSFSGNIYTTEAITANCSVSFSFSQAQRTVTASAGSGGSIAPSLRTVGHGSTASFTVTPNIGYSHGAVGGTCPSGSFNGNTYTTGAITSNCSVSFSFTAGSAKAFPWLKFLPAIIGNK